MSDNSPIIHSLLETDLYKFTMWQALFNSAYNDNEAEYRFVCRRPPPMPLSALKAAVERELDHLCGLAFQDEELDYLRSLRYMKSSFVDFLSIFRLQRRFIRIEVNGDALEIVARGPQVHVMFFEIFVLAIVSELHAREWPQQAALAEGRRRLADKIAQLREFESEAAAERDGYPFAFFDFGLRRRFSRAWHEEVVTMLKVEVPQFFKGTSNTYLAMKHGLTPMGTVAHEFMQTFQAVHDVPLRNSQKAALEAWVQTYRGDLGVALTDVVGMDAFLRDFDLYFAKLFDGLRHDSGDPVEWGEKALAHYAKLHIDAHTKRLVFSDRLNIEKSIALWRHFARRAQTGFGIGTNLTHDFGPQFPALEIVMKLVRCNGRPVAKLSDSPGKTICDDATFLAYLRSVFNLPA
ncbi:nicotinate phosphoribosyltransferase [Noviherbaspirillum autotrophicum]|uniref:Nicotinate phosphoribosyltransferase n=1 Tax=Noviherbaspirillum autotrophicum TaxID=709839 RepID=A0A0C2BKC7_9BURK|nr:nicotinate phosphoribosyltransferase [Noviherbaspirillum autotrophicum]KIF81705.1 nicotinate phosphoribosyltransferase [Noviherbaspirillum autotrophicum]